MSGQLRYKALHMDSTEISGVLKQLYGLRAFAHGYRFAALFGIVWLKVSGDKKACLMRGSEALRAYFFNQRSFSGNVSAAGPLRNRQLLVGLTGSVWKPQGEQFFAR